jgi:hypothetical protein
VNSAAPLVLPAQAQHHRARERDGMGLSDACVDGDLTSLSLSLLQSIAGQQPPSICICMHAGGGGARFGPAAGRRCLPPRLHARTAAASSGASSARSTARTQWSTPRWCSS